MDHQTRDLIRDLRRSATDLPKLLGRVLGRRRAAVAISADAVARWQHQAPDAWAAASAWFRGQGITVIVTETSGERCEAPLGTLAKGGLEDGRDWTLVVVRHRSPRGARPIYMLSSFQPGQIESGLVSSECFGDVTLIRVLERLVEAPEIRLQVWQRVRDSGYASVEGLPAPAHDWRRYSTVGRAGAPEAASELSFADVDDIAERVAAFLREGQARQFCHACLAGLFALSFDIVRKVTTVLRVFNEFRIDTGVCLACHKHRMTIRAASSASSRSLGADIA